MIWLLAIGCLSLGAALGIVFGAWCSASRALSLEAEVAELKLRIVEIDAAAFGEPHLYLAGGTDVEVRRGIYDRELEEPRA